MESTLVVVGLNHRTAPLEVRERFWMGGCRQAEALARLSEAEGIDEALVFSTCNRTEFVVWGDATLAVNSVLRFLTAECDLKLCEWNSFYRLIDEHALAHAFRVACGLDSMCIGEEQVARQVSLAWQQARRAGSSGHLLNAVLRKAQAVRRRVRKETALGFPYYSAPSAAVELAAQILGSLAKTNIVILGAGRIGEAATLGLAGRGAQSVTVVQRAESRSPSWTQNTGICTCAFENRWAALAQADLVISATSAPGFVLTAEDMSKLAAERKGRKLLVIDLALPRDIDPGVRDFAGVLLYDLEGVERAVQPRRGTREGEREAEKIVLAEAQAFRTELMRERSASDLTDLRHRLDEICRQELESFRSEQGPFPREQEQLLTAVTARITHKIAGSLSREWKELEGRGHARVRATV